MIKLERNMSPMFLTPSEIVRRTALFKSTGEAVWADNRIKESLLQLSFGKCAYCECKLTIESKYLEVEHFASKDKYPDEVIEWENLFPSCKRCNTTKGSHDVKMEAIVNPFEDFPSAHFAFAAYRFRSTTPKGEMTSAVVGLNHPQRAVKVRFQIGEQIQVSVDNAVSRLASYGDSNTTLRRRKLLESVEGLLRECVPSVPYAATAATVLHKHSVYPALKADMESRGLWDAELQELHQKSHAICL